jgi:hypothetical protein
MQGARHVVVLPVRVMKMLIQTSEYAGFTQLVLIAMTVDLKWPRPITRYPIHNQI